MEAKRKSPSPIAWVLGQTGDHGGQYVLSVLLAIIGVGFSAAPYYVVIQIAKALMAGNREPGFYLTRCAVMAALWVGRVLCHAFSTATSHKATFAVLGEIRKRCTEKLTHMPLGAVLEQSSGALKNTLIERIDSIETTLAHIVPEFTANLLIPIIILVYIFMINWRMGLATLATVPLGMFCYVFMMAGSAKFYEHTVTATKALNDTAVEYIGGIQVIKVFGKTKSSYDRFVHDAFEAANSFICWMRASIIPFTFAMVIMPATMVSVLPIGGLLVKGGSLLPEDFVTIIILSVGVITPIMDRSIFRLSDGEKQKIACASVDVAGAGIILLDEPSANLDYEATLALRDLILEWRRQGKTIIAAEHRIAYLWDLIDRFSNTPLIYSGNGIKYRVELEYINRLFREVI